jgi:tRNA pseudouridine55 synthase
MSLVDAVLVIDKPSGLTSFDVVRGIRRATGTRRVGHGGTLDPLASGVLPICLG